MKAKIRMTGEVVDIITYSGHTYRSDIDVVSYIDSKGNECVDMKMNRFWDFEDVEECYLSTRGRIIDWEERRFQLAMNVMQGMIANPSYDVYDNSLSDNNTKLIVSSSIKYADEMIKQLNSE